MLIYKIADADDWLKAFEDGPFDGTAKDKEDGFIHFSTGEQLIETLKLHYGHAMRPLAVLAVDIEVLGDTLKWETSRNGDLFPHLYSPLSRDTVKKTLFSHYQSMADSDFATIRDFIADAGVFEH